MKNKASLKHIEACSYCYNCGWRTPLNNNPEGCVLGIKTKYDMEQCDGHASCDRYITDTTLKKHIKEMLR
jgi:heterodisulfide reductase subunit C